MEFVCVKDPNNSVFVVPSALNSNTWQLWLCSMLYMSTALFALVESVRSYLLNRGFKTYRFNFLLFSFLFSLLRGIMTLIAFPDWEEHMDLLYFFNLFLPNFLLYYIFSLLALFVIQVFMTFNNQEDLIENLYRIYHIVQFLLLIGCALAAVFLGQMFNDEPISSDRVEKWDQIGSIYNVFLYAILMIGGGYFSVRCYTVISTIVLSERQKLQQKRYLALTVLFCVLFTCRFLWCTLYFAEKNPFMAMIETWIKNGDQVSFDNAFLVFYTFFELFPTFVVVMSFRAPFHFSEGKSEAAIRRVNAHAASRLATPSRRSPNSSPRHALSSPRGSPRRLHEGLLSQDSADVETLVLSDYM